MWDRIEDGKSPLPAFSECAAGAEGPNHQEGYAEYQEGYAAYIPPHQHCIKSHKVQRGYTYGKPNYVSICDEFEDVPGQYLEGVGLPAQFRRNGAMVLGQSFGRQSALPLHWHEAVYPHSRKRKTARQRLLLLK